MFSATIALYTDQACNSSTSLKSFLTNLNFEFSKFLYTCIHVLELNIINQK